MLVKLTAQDATWWDHHEMIYWLWATLHTADVFLKAAQEERAASEEMFSKPMNEWDSYTGNSEQLRRHSGLSSHQFLNALGVLLRVLQRSQHLFPPVQPSYSRANHTIAEGKQLRDLVEHAYGKDGYLAGGGKMRDKFVKEEAGVAADAISLIVNEHGHWLGNRLCVERVIEEITAIQVEALKVAAPMDDDD